MKIWGFVTLLIGIAVLVAPMIGSFGTQLGIWPFFIGIQVFTYATGLAIFGCVTGLIGLLVSWVRKREISVKRNFLIGTLGSGVLVAYLVFVVIPGLQMPMLYNVSTDLVNPPSFSQEVLEVRGESNPVDMTDGIKDKVRAGYPQLKPYVTELSIEEMVKIVEAAIDDFGWETHGHQTDDDQPEVVTYYATATTFWFRFKDDIAIRIRPSESGGSVVDVHSVSRVGISDLGKNAARIESFVEELDNRMSS